MKERELDPRTGPHARTFGDEWVGWDGTVREADIDQKVSTFGRDLKRQGIEVDADILVRGLKDAMAGAQPAITDQDVQETMRVFRQELNAKKQAETKRQAEENKRQEEAFLAENSKKGRYPDLALRPPAQGPEGRHRREADPLYDRVTVNYRSMLLNGTEFLLILLRPYTCHSPKILKPGIASVAGESHRSVDRDQNHHDERLWLARFRRSQ